MDNYQTGTAANINVLLTTLDTWLVSTVGYTRNLTPTAVGNGNRAHYQITTTRGNTLYTNFRSFRKETSWGSIFTGWVANYAQGALIDGLAMNLSKAYVGTGVLFDIQGGQVNAGNDYHQGIAAVAAAYDNIPAYYFFHLSDPHMVAVVLEWQLGQYSLLIWGEPDSNGAGVFSPNNGYFYYGSSTSITPWLYGPSAVFPDSNDFYQTIRVPHGYYQFYNNPQSTNLYEHNTFFQLDPTLHTGKNGWLGPADDSVPYSSQVSTYVGSGYDGVNCPGLWVGFKDWSNQNRRIPLLMPHWDHYGAGQRMVNSGAGVTVFQPIMLWWSRNTHDYVYLGSMPEIFYASLEILTPGDTIVMGSDEYLVVPAGKKPNPFEYTPSYDPSGRADQNYGYGLVIKKN